MDFLTLGAGGLIALIAAGLIAILSPGGGVSLIAAAALCGLGFLEFGFARAIFDLGTTGSTEAFAISLALTLPVSSLWLLFSVTLGRTRGVRLGAWRWYLMLVGAISAAALAWTIAGPPPPAAIPGDRGFTLHGPQWLIIAVVWLNVILLSAKFESTHLSLRHKRREAFRPALLGVLGGSGLLSYLIFSMLATGRAETADMVASAAPASLLAFLLVVSLIRGRIGEAHAPEDRLAVTATTSLLVAVSYVGWTAALLWLTRWAGMSLATGLLWITVAGLLTAVIALTVSNRLRRKLDLFLDPVWFEPRAARRWGGEEAVAPLLGARGLDDLCRLIPENARDVSGVDPVTLFLADPAGHSFRAMGSTIAPLPDAVIPEKEPLPIELRRSRRPIRFTGRSDDLEYVGIYVENARQIDACGAVCAVPILGDEGLIGFLLCGARPGEAQPRGEDLVLLNLVSREYADHLERFPREAPKEEGRPSSPGLA